MEADTSTYTPSKEDDEICGKRLSETNIPPSLIADTTAQNIAYYNTEMGMLYTRNPDEKVKIASTTKLMTALVSEELFDTNEVITINKDYKLDTDPKLQEIFTTGNQIAFKDLLTLMLLPSSNNAAMCLAENGGKKLLSSSGDKEIVRTTYLIESVAINKFVEEMNTRAAALEMNDTLFANSTGLDEEISLEDQHGTAADVVKMSKCALDDNLISTTTKKKQETISVLNQGKKIDYETTNSNLLLDLNSECIGLKTGLTDKAGGCLSASLHNKDTKDIVVVLGEQEPYNRFTDANQLYATVGKEIFDYSCINPGPHQELIDDEKGVFAEITYSSKVDTKYKVAAKNTEFKIRIFGLSGQVTQKLNVKRDGAINAGDIVGNVEFTQDGKVIATEDLIALDNCAEPSVGDRISKFFNDLYLLFFQHKKSDSDEIYNYLPPVWNG